MLNLLKTLLGLFQAVARLFADRQLIDAGRAAQNNEAMKEVMANEDKAKAAVDVADPVRDDRLRNRFDRSRRK